MKILITGGASGLGKAITEKFANDTSHIVYITYNSSKENAASLEKRFNNVRSLYVDFSSTDSVEGLLLFISETQPDLLVNNAITGYTQTHFHKMEPALFERSFKTNIFPVLLITQKFIEIARKRKSGKIITILSAAIINKPPLGFSEYAANKAYLHSMVKSWATENGALGITSNSISPSFMNTNLTSNTDSRLVENMVSDTPAKQLLTVEEVADTVLFLAFATAHINGANIILNAAKDVL